MRFAALALIATVSGTLAVASNDDGSFSAPYDAAEDVALPVFIHNTEIQVPCRQCQGEDAQIELNFAVVESELYVNGIRLFPLAAGDFLAQVSSSGDDALDEPAKLGVALAVVDQVSDVEAGIQSVDLWFTILEVQHQWMEGPLTVRLELIQNLDGEIISIGESHVAEDRSRTSGRLSGPDCNDVLCSSLDWIHQMMEKFPSRLKGTGYTRDSSMRSGKQVHLGGVDRDALDLFEDEAQPSAKGIHSQSVPVASIWSLAMVFVVFPILLCATFSVGCIFLVVAIATIYTQIRGQLGDRTGAIRLIDEESVAIEKSTLQTRFNSR